MPASPWHDQEGELGRDPQACTGKFVTCKTGTSDSNRSGPLQKAAQQLSGRYDRKPSTAYVNGFAGLTAPEALYGNKSFASGPVDGDSRRSAVKPFCLEPSREAFQKRK